MGKPEKNLGSSDKSAESVKPKLEQPYALKVKNVSRKSVALKWKCRDGEVVPDGYRIYYKTVTGREEIKHVDVSHDKLDRDTTYNVNDLSPGTKYEFHVVAYKGNEESDRSEKIEADTPDFPAKPKGLKVENISHDRATLKWSEGRDSDKSVRFKVGYSPVADTTDVEYIPVENPRCTVLGLTPGTTFQFFVIAYNEVGESERSDVQQARTNGRPANPVGFKITDITHDHATLKWKAGPGSDKPDRYKMGYTPVTDYENVRYIHVEQTNCIVDGLLPGTEYKFFVIACNEVGESDRSDVELGKTKGLPAEPAGLKIEDITHDHATLTWEAGADPDLPVRYKVGYTPVTDYENVRYIHVEQTYCTVDGLTSNTEYRFFVIAYNNVGESGRSDSQQARTKEIPTKVTESWYFGPGLSILVVFLGFALQTYYTGSSNTVSIYPEEFKGMAEKLNDLGVSFSTLKLQQMNDKDSLKEMVEQSVSEIKHTDDISLKELTKKVDTTANDVRSAVDKLDELEKAKRALESQADDMNKTFQNQLKETEESLTQKISELKKFVDEFDETFSNYKKSFGEFEDKTDQKMKDMKNRFKELSEKAQQMVKDVSEQFEPQVEKLKKAKQEVDEILRVLNSDMEAIKPNTFNKESLTMAFGIVIVIEFVLALCIYVQFNRSAASPDVHKDMNARDVLQRIPRGVTLANTVCIISFDEARQKEHETLVQSALNSQCETTSFVVRRHEHLMKLPKCKFFIMCTEFSERHVIIEEPGLGLGDLKRCTYEAIQKYRASMVILYTRDPGSRNLVDKHYNTNIYCVSKQPELVDLRNKGCFISTYDGLSDFQKKALKDAVTSVLTHSQLGR